MELLRSATAQALARMELVSDVAALDHPATFPITEILGKFPDPFSEKVDWENLLSAAAR